MYKCMCTMFMYLCIKVMSSGVNVNKGSNRKQNWYQNKIIKMLAVNMKLYK